MRSAGEPFSLAITESIADTLTLSDTDAVAFAESVAQPDDAPANHK